MLWIGCSYVPTSCVSLSADTPQTQLGHGTAWFGVKQKKVFKNKHSKLHLTFVISRESGRLKVHLSPWALCFHWEKAALKAPIYLLSTLHSEPHGFTGKDKINTLHIQHMQVLFVTSWRKVQLRLEKKLRKKWFLHILKKSSLQNNSRIVRCYKWLLVIF